MIHQDSIHNNPMEVNSSQQLVSQTRDIEMREIQSPISELKLKDIEDEGREYCKQSPKESVSISPAKDLVEATQKTVARATKEARAKEDELSPTESAAEAKIRAANLSEREIPYSADPGLEIKNSRRINLKHNQNIE